MNSKKYTFTILSFLLVFICAVRSFAQTTPDPGIPGTLPVTKAEYNLGDKAWKCPHFPDSVEVRGSVHYPTSLSAGPYPVIVFLHGRHETCYKTSNPSNTSSAWPCPSGWQSITSYEGYDYLATNMASHGYIVISISCNAINATDNSVGDYGMQGRAELMQHHLDLWNTWNTSSSGPFASLFVGKLNMQNIGTMGHSRGGEGVIFQALYNQSLGNPYGIKAVLTLAPVDFERHIMHGIPLMNVAPYCDGDVSDIEGVLFYDDSRYTDTLDEAPKHSVLMMGANHNFFNTVWTPGSYIAGGADDWLYGYSAYDPQCGPSATGNKRFDTTKQKAALTAYMSAFYRVYIGHESVYAPILTVDDIVPPASSMLDSSEVYVSYHPSPINRRDLNRTDSLDRLTDNTLTGAVTDSAFVGTQICGGGYSEPDCGFSIGGNQEPHNGSSSSQGLSQMDMQWNDTAAWYQNALPLAYQVLTTYNDIQFRVTQNFLIVPSGTNLNFSVQLTDSEGHAARVPVANYTHALFSQPGVEPGDLPKLLFNTVKLPLSAFTGVDLSRVRTVRFIFNKSVAGFVMVSDLAFSNPPCSGLQSAFTDSISLTGHHVTFTNTTAANTTDSLTWLWNFGDIASGTNDTSTLHTPPMHIYSTGGPYTACLYVTAYRKNGFICADTFCKSISPVAEGVSQLTTPHITIAPNPASDHLMITGAAAGDALTLVDVYGQSVFTTSIGNGTIRLPNDLAPGIYYAVVSTVGGRVYNKIVITR